MNEKCDRRGHGAILRSCNAKSKWVMLQLESNPRTFALPMQHTMCVMDLLINQHTCTQLQCVLYNRKHEFCALAYQCYWDLKCSILYLNAT